MMVLNGEKVEKRTRSGGIRLSETRSGGIRLKVCSIYRASPLWHIIISLSIQPMWKQVQLHQVRPGHSTVVEHEIYKRIG